MPSHVNAAIKLLLEGEEAANEKLIEQLGQFSTRLQNSDEKQIQAQAQLEKLQVSYEKLHNSYEKLVESQIKLLERVKFLEQDRTSNDSTVLAALGLKSIETDRIAQNGEQRYENHSAALAICDHTTTATNVRMETENNSNLNGDKNSTSKDLVNTYPDLKVVAISPNTYFSKHQLAAVAPEVVKEDLTRKHEVQNEVLQQADPNSDADMSQNATVQNGTIENESQVSKNAELVAVTPLYARNNTMTTVEVRTLRTKVLNMAETSAQTQKSTSSRSSVSQEVGVPVPSVRTRARARYLQPGVSTRRSSVPAPSKLNSISRSRSTGRFSSASAAAKKAMPSRENGMSRLATAALARRSAMVKKSKSSRNSLASTPTPATSIVSKTDPFARAQSLSSSATAKKPKTRLNRQSVRLKPVTPGYSTTLTAKNLTPKRRAVALPSTLVTVGNKSYTSTTNKAVLVSTDSALKPASVQKNYKMGKPTAEKASTISGRKSELVTQIIKVEPVTPEEEALNTRNVGLLLKPSVPPLTPRPRHMIESKSPARSTLFGRTVKPMKRFVPDAKGNVSAAHACIDVSGLSLPLQACHRLITMLLSQKSDIRRIAWPFYKPPTPLYRAVDESEEDKPVVANPIDLDDVKNKLESGAYKFPTDFLADMELMFSNLFDYEDEESNKFKNGKELEDRFKMEFSKIKKEFPEEMKGATPSPPRRSSRDRVNEVFENKNVGVDPEDSDESAQSSLEDQSESDSQFPSSESDADSRKNETALEIQLRHELEMERINAQEQSEFRLLQHLYPDLFPATPRLDWETIARSNNMFRTGDPVEAPTLLESPAWPILPPAPTVSGTTGQKRQEDGNSIQGLEEGPSKFKRLRVDTPTPAANNGGPGPSSYNNFPVLYNALVKCPEVILTTENLVQMPSVEERMLLAQKICGSTTNSQKEMFLDVIKNREPKTKVDSVFAVDFTTLQPSTILDLRMMVDCHIPPLETTSNGRSADRLPEPDSSDSD